MLQLIVLKNKWAGRRRFFLKQFRKYLLGESRMGVRTSIKNESVITFEYDRDNNILEAFAKEPIIIENKGLGYKLTLELIHFEIKDFAVSYLGFMRYENMEGNERKQKKWAKERQMAYNGSLRDFLNAAIQRNGRAGFLVDKVKLVPNPDPPSEELIEAAEEVVKKYGGPQTDPTSTDPNVIRKLNNALDFLRKVQINRFIEIPIQRNLIIDDYFARDGDDGMRLFMEDHENTALRIKYIFEFQESNYINPNENYKGKKRQVSRLTLLNPKVLVNTMGTLHNPLDVLLEGYWGFEKLSDKLPLDYKPKNPLNK